MGKKRLELFNKVADELGLKVDNACEAIYGKFNSYNIIFVIKDTYNLYLSLSRFGNKPLYDELKVMRKKLKSVFSCLVKGNSIKIVIKKKYIGTHNFMPYFKESLTEITEYLRENQYENVCQACGTTENIGEYMIEGMPTICCTSCFSEGARACAEKENKDANISENVLGGIIGATIGSILGIVSIIIMFKLGYVSSISGIILSVCSLMGYQILGGKISYKGIIISSLLVIIGAYFGSRIGFSMVVSEETSLDLFEVFTNLSKLVKEGYLNKEVYYGALAKVYMYAGLGAFGIIYAAVKNKKLQFSSSRLGEN